ncbi:MAG: ankyrin repeat domain-containing protein [Candidatus Protochlamydia sp.]|nr:ankyrin repeat domain-containing protein [Candidatus Protochlamydia sp.]
MQPAFNITNQNQPFNQDQQLPSGETISGSKCINLERERIANLYKGFAKELLTFPEFKKNENINNWHKIFSMTDSAGNTPLHFALNTHNESIFARYLSLIKPIPKNTYYLNLTNKEGESAIHSAIRQKIYTAVIHLIKAGADVDTINPKNLQTPLHNVIYQYVNYNDKNESCYDKKKSAIFDMIKLLINCGANCDRQEGVSEQSPLHIAAEYGELELIDLLVNRAGAYINIRDDVGETPLFAAIRHGHVAAVKKLLELKSDPSAKNSEGESPLDYAENEEIINLIKIKEEKKSISLIFNSKETTNFSLQNSKPFHFLNIKDVKLINSPLKEEDTADLLKTKDVKPTNLYLKIKEEEISDLLKKKEQIINLAKIKEEEINSLIKIKELEIENLLINLKVKK